MVEIQRITIPQASYPNGTLTFGPVSIPSKIDAIEVRVARRTTASPTIWPNAGTTVDFHVEGLFGGQWETLVRGTAAGGIVAYRGIESAASVLRCQWRADRDPTQIRATAIIAGGPLVTSAIVIAYKVASGMEIRGRA